LAGLENLKRTSPHGLGRSLEAAWTHLQQQQRRTRRDVTRNSRRDVRPAKNGLEAIKNSRDFTLAKHDSGVTRNSRDFIAAKSGSNSGEFYILEQPAVLKKAKVKKQQQVNKQLPAAVELPSPLTPPSALFSGLRQARHYIFYYFDH
jgi:hypothetical protein